MFVPDSSFNQLALSPIHQTIFDEMSGERPRINNYRELERNHRLILRRNGRGSELMPHDLNLMNLLFQENMNHNNHTTWENDISNIHTLTLLRDITRDLLSVNQRIQAPPFPIPHNIYMPMPPPMPMTMPMTMPMPPPMPMPPMPNLFRELFNGLGGGDGFGIRELLQRSLSDMGGVKKYVSDDVINDLKEPIGGERLDGNGEVATCSICMESIGAEPNPEVPCVILPCKHHFHKECIVPWFKDNNKCPDCRKELPFKERSLVPTQNETEEDIVQENTGISDEDEDEDDDFDVFVEPFILRFTDNNGQQTVIVNNEMAHSTSVSPPTDDLEDYELQLAIRQSLEDMSGAEAGGNTDDQS
jgi:hypothetical protein